MDELFFLISNLPNLALTNQEWDMLDDIVTSLEEKAIAAFKKKWDTLVSEFKTNPIKSVYYNDLCVYLENWFKSTAILVKLNQNLAALWQEFNSDPLGADELLDLTIELLPVNLSLLKLSLPKIEKAALIGSRGQIGYSLTILYSAVQTKIARIEYNKNLLEPGTYADKIHFAVNKFKQKRYLIALTRICENFIESLYHDIIKTIKDNDPLGYSIFIQSSPAKEKHAIIQDIIDRIENESTTLSCLKLIQGHMHRYILLQDFIYTLKRQRYTDEEKLIEFSEKFSNFIYYIRANPRNQTGFLLKAANDLFGSYSFFPSPTEEQFIIHIKQIIDKAKISLEITSPPKPSTGV